MTKVSNEEQSNNANVLLADSISQNNAISFVEWIALSAWEYNGNTKTWYNYMECFFPTTKELMELYFEKYFR